MSSYSSLRLWRAAGVVLLALFPLNAHALPPQQLGLQPVVSGLANPVTIANAGDGSKRLFVVEQGGTIRIVSGGQVLSTPFLDISGKVLFDGNERGLLGLAFDANYTSNGFFYVYYTHQQTAQFTTGMITIARYSVSGDPNVADPNSELVLKTQDHTQAPNHNGGSLLWGPDGCLYASIGDGGTGGVNSQDPTNLLGKIIRISPLDGSACPGNPSFGMGARPEIWALGLRNPWRITFDRQTHDLMIADVGQSAEEEVDFQPAGVGGQNYQWPCKEGLLSFNTSASCTVGTSTPPVLVYDHVNGNCAIIGGYRYRGSRFPSLIGTYIYGDLCTGQIWGGVQSGNTWSSSPLLLSGLSISTFGEDEAGEVYVANHSATAGTIYHLVLLQQPSTHDFNGGGMSDILWQQTGGMVAVWLMNGASAIGGGSPGSAGGNWAIVGQRDFNGDGFADILWRDSSSGQPLVWLMNGATMIGVGSPGAAANPWSVAGSGDFNGDGFGDVLWYNSSTGQAVVWLLNGTSVIGGGSPGSAANPWTIAGTGDFNGDGKSDILWRNTSTGQVVIWFLNGGSTIGGGSPGMVTSDWTVAGTGDFNGDAKSDILWRNTNTGQVVIWLVSGATLLGSGSPGTAIADWIIAQTGDFNGDGMSDILWRNTTSGQVALWFMNGTSTSGGVSPGTVTTDWRIQGMSAD